MAGFITMAQAVMGATGGFPVKPSGANTVIERLRAAKSMLPGDIGNILSQVLQNGPGSILQNPIQGVLGNLTSQIGGLNGLIGQIGGGNLGGLTDALGASGLSGALSSLSGVSNALSGLTGAASGGFGLLDALGHANIISALGTNVPAGLGLETAMAPILMGNSLGAMSGQLTQIASSITGSSFDPTVAITQVNAMTGSIQSTLTASQNAFSTVQGQAVAIAQVSGIISALGDTQGGALGGIASMLIQPQHVPEIMAALTEQITA